MEGVFSDTVRDSISALGLALTFFQTWLAIEQIRGRFATTPKPSRPKATARTSEASTCTVSGYKRRRTYLDTEERGVLLRCGTLAFTVLALPVTFFVLAAKGCVPRNRDSVELGTYLILGGLLVTISVAFMLHLWAASKARLTRVRVLVAVHVFTAGITATAIWALLWSGRQNNRTLVVEFVETFGYMTIVCGGAVAGLYALRSLRNVLRGS